MNLLDKIRELIARLAQLTPDELAEVRTDITAAFDEIDALETTPENVAILNELADAGEQVMARTAEIQAEQEAAEASKEEARARRARLDATPEDEAAEGAEGVDENAPAEGSEEGSEESVDEGAGDRVPVTASGGRRAGTTIGNMASGGRGAANRSPEHEPQVNTTSLVASGQGHGMRSGDVIPGRYDLARLMAGSLSRMRKDARALGDVVLASAEWQYPEDRRLESGPDELMSSRDAEAIDAVCHPSALVATGGVCSPVNVDYSLGTWADASRPLRDGLPAFQATRGGLTFRTPPTIAALAAATGIWTAATDANPAGATKALETISCPTPSTVLVDAVSTRLGFGNMMSQFDPETVAANTDLALAAAARKAEVNLLNKISAGSVADITTAAVMGATRDFLATLDKALAIYKNIHRLRDEQVITVIVPRWVRDLIRVDRVRELAHDGQSIDPLAIPDTYIDGLFALRNVKPIYTMESLAAGGGIPAQDWTGFTASSAIPVFPASMAWHMFVEGAVQFLDAGRLDLGVVRDSTLDATNDYETFVETFEGIAIRSFAGGVLQFNTTLCANGQSGAAVTVGTCA